MLEEFKKFILRGNVVDLAVGVIIGGAFGKIVDSLVKDVIMPPIGIAMGKVDFANLMILLKEGDKAPAPYPTLAKAQEAGAVAIGYGQFLNTVISFLIIGFVLFMIIRSVNKLMPPPPPADDKRDCPKCYSSIMKKATRCPNCTSEVEAVVALGREDARHRREDAPIAGRGHESSTGFVLWLKCPNSRSASFLL